MKRILGQATLALALVVAGWAFAHAQTQAPAFELQVNVSDEATTITCVKGCELAWVERGLNPNSRPTEMFSFVCNVRGVNGSAVPCSSGKVGGWLR
jgi:hypothetical protein